MDHVAPLMFALGLAPLLILIYWMWRVRLRRRLSGLIISSDTVSRAQPAI